MPADFAGGFSAFQDETFGKVVAVVKAASSLAATDMDFQRSSNPEFAADADTTGQEILGLVNALLKSSTAGSDIVPPVLRELDDLDVKWNDVVEAVDFLLERADTCLDEYTGAIKQKNPEPLPGAKISSKPYQKPSYKIQAHSWVSRHLIKPQLQFDVKPDNFAPPPFRPLLTVKPHAKVALERSFQLFTNESGNKQYMHPYVEEIKTLEYPKRLFQKQEPQKYLPLEETKAIWVDNPEQLFAMWQELKNAKEIAVDLEHHDQRSFIGFVCLMQITTRENDWIVDTLKLRTELQILNDVFTDPDIIKVFHGSSMDIIWLQRDFGLYVVGLFDTYWAARVLQFSGHGLAYLLKKYVDFDSDKQYQLADWRLRPLSDDMLKYARSDTHFLLYCFDMLRNELLDKSNPSDSETSKMHQVIQGSQDASLRLYEREIYDADNGDRPMGWRNILGRSQESLNPMQTSVFKAVHRWRDITARIEDESVHYILPRPHLFNIARKMPSEVAGVLACCPRHCPQIKIRASELVYIIREAMDAPEVRAWKDSMARGIEIPHQKQQPVAARATPVVTKEGPRVDVFALEGTLEIKAEKSSFWGTCDDSSRWQSIIKGKNDPMDELRLAVPLPQLTAEVFVTRDYSLPASSHKPMDPGSRAEHEYVKHRPKKDSENDVIIVRSIGGGYKRKLDEAVDPSEDSKTNPVAREAPAEQNDEGGLKSESPPLDPASLAADGTKCKGRRKKKKKSEGEKETGEGQDDEMTTGVSLPAARPGQPFDYASAPSVLHARPQNDKKDSNKGKKTFDPYSQSGNALRGLSRGNQERAGRSLTFQS